MGPSSKGKTPLPHSGNGRSIRLGSTSTRDVASPRPAPRHLLAQYKHRVETSFAQGKQQSSRACFRVGSAPGRNPGVFATRGFDSSHAHCWDIG